MIIKNIIQIGNPILSKKSKFVSNIKFKEIKNIIKDLVDSLRHYSLVGMAAPQIGKNFRIFITEIRKTKYRKGKETDKLRIFINPRIIWSSKDKVIMYEGCGSVAYSKIFGPVKRPKNIIIEAYNEKGDKFKLKADRLLSRVIQHENDHLNGISFIEKITDMRKTMSSEEYFKMIALKHKK